MTISYDLYNKIRKLYAIENLSQRKIAEILGISRNTVSKYYEGKTTPDIKVEVNKKSALKKSVMDEIDKYIKINMSQPSKQKLTAINVWEHLSNKGYNIGQSTVRKYVREIKNYKPEIYIPLDFDPGEAMQVDWGERSAIINGKKVVFPYFCTVLPYSYAIHVSVFPDMTYKSFFMGHIKAFEFYGGVPKKCIYDNLKTAVFKGTGKNAIPQEKFKKMIGHYAVEPVFCNGYSPWEKGAVENVVDIAKKIALTPMPKVEGYEQLQQIVDEKCLKYITTHTIKSRKKSIKEMFEEERQHLLPLPVKAFDISDTIKAYVYPNLTIRYEDNLYSVPEELVGNNVTLKITPFKIFVYYKGTMYYCHDRLFEKKVNRFIPEHYLNILLKKPRAINNALPLKKGDMPQELITFKKLCKDKDMYEQLVSILLLGRTIKKEKVLWAVNKANHNTRPSYNLVCSYLKINSEIINENLDSELKLNQSKYDYIMFKGGKK